MDDYYKEQLDILHERGRDFAHRYPALAPLLAEQGTDPDVERLLEGTAFLTARIKERLDQGTPELIQSLLQLTFPQALQPVPSSTLIRFNALQSFNQSVTVAPGTQIASTPVDGVSCTYCTMRPLTLLPLQVTCQPLQQNGGQTAELVINIASGAPLVGLLNNSPLSLFCAGDYHQAVMHYQALLDQVIAIDLVEGQRRTRLAADTLRAQSPDEGDLRLPGRLLRKNRLMRDHRPSFALFRYLQLPQQLLFIEIHGLQQHLYSDTRQISLHLTLKKPFDKLPEFTADSLLPNVAPATNAFMHPANPLVIDQHREEYLITPQDGVAQSLDIIGLYRVAALKPGGEVEVYAPYELFTPQITHPLYTLRYRPGRANGHDAGVEYLLSLIHTPQQSFRKRTLSIDLVCYNHTLPRQLRLGDICHATDNSPAQATFSNIVTPTPPVSRILNESLLWRFISLVNCNLLSLATPEALRSLVHLHIPGGLGAQEYANANQRRVEAITAFSSRAEDLLYKGKLLRGRTLNLSLDQSAFTSRADMMLFAGVIDKFLSGFAPLNSYTRLVLKNETSGETHTFAPRLGERQLF